MAQRQPCQHLSLVVCRAFKRHRARTIALRHNPVDAFEPATRLLLDPGTIFLAGHGKDGFVDCDCFAHHAAVMLLSRDGRSAGVVEQQEVYHLCGWFATLMPPAPGCAVIRWQPRHGVAHPHDGLSAGPELLGQGRHGSSGRKSRPHHFPLAIVQHGGAAQDRPSGLGTLQAGLGPLDQQVTLELRNGIDDPHRHATGGAGEVATPKRRAMYLDTHVR
jgi:hypothetical protein